MKLFLFFLSILLTFLSYSQSKYTLSGYITDAKNGEVMVGTKIFIPSINQGTFSNNYGFYSLSVPSGTYQVEFRTGVYAIEVRSLDLTKNLVYNLEIGSDAVQNLNEVVINGKKGENTNSTKMGQVELEMENIKTLPAFMGEVDVIKIIQLLPGVSSVSEGGQGFYVRGGGPDQNLVLLDAALINSGAQEIETQLEYAEYMLKKQEELKSKGVGSEFDYETARNAVKSLRAKLNSLNTQRGKSAIKAPFSGIIDVVYAKQGQMAGPQSPLLRLVNNSNVEITASISEKHLSKIKVGTLIEVSFPNFNNTILNLKVNTVGNFIEPTNRTFRIAAKVSGNKELLPNMLAELRITDFTVENGLVIPAKSILKSQDNSDYVWVALPSSKGNFKVKKIAVELIENQDGEALIKDNAAIMNGTKIIVEGARGITEKDQVRIK